MAAKVGNLIGSETGTTTFWFSITNTNTNTNTNTKTKTKTSVCASSNTTSSITQERRRRRKYLRIGMGRHISYRPPSPLVQATSGSNSNEPNSPFPSTFQDDLKYLLKLVIASILGAAVIKYGSAALPTITRPDITVALLIISTPSLIALLLLAKQSRKD